VQQVFLRTSEMARGNQRKIQLATIELTPVIRITYKTVAHKFKLPRNHRVFPRRRLLLLFSLQFRQDCIDCFNNTERVIHTPSAIFCSLITRAF